MKKDLHVASTLLELEKLAFKDISGLKHEKVYKSAEKLFLCGFDHYQKGDEETAYIFLLRFKNIYDVLSRADRHDNYSKKRLGNELKTVNELLLILKTSLQDRYNIQKNIQASVTKVVETPQPQRPQSTPLHFPNGYVTSSELFTLIDIKADIVILDTRTSEDFQQSSMKHLSCVNIPEDIIMSGQSANLLGKEIPVASLEQWDRRQRAALTILMDWSATRDTIAASKINILRNILVNWDPKMANCHPPVILDGGYLDLLQTYPMLCSNPHVVHQVQNSVLNELLYLDNIEYPSAEESAGMAKPISYQPIFDRSTKPVLNDNVLSLSKKIVNEERELDNKRAEYEKSLEILRHNRQLEAEEGMRLELQQREEKLIEDMSLLEKRQLELNKENGDLRKQLQLMNENMNKVTMKQDEPHANGNIDIREKLLLEAREKKKNLIKNDNITTADLKKNISPYLIQDTRPQEFTPPTANRRSKPGAKQRIIEPGTTGLKNFGTTCYMNSIIQCLCHTQKIATFFCNPDYIKELNKRQGSSNTMTTVFASLLQSLWTGEQKSILPKQLKAAVNSYCPRYKAREHQDAHEFFLTMSSWLHEELRKDLKRPKQVAWTPMQKNWMEQTEGKWSILTDTFVGQNKSIITCSRCRKKKETYEIFYDLSLCLPPGDSCSIEDCFNLYFGKQSISGYRCSKCNTDVFVSQKIQVAAFPSTLVLSLKRFSEVLSGDYVSFVKNAMSVSFPLDKLYIYNFNYSLFAVVNHRGSLEHGHYTASCKNLINGKWYNYDDDRVTEISVEDLSFSDVYMMFYENNNKD